MMRDNDPGARVLVSWTGTRLLGGFLAQIAHATHLPTRHGAKTET